jgi:deazaflavin-dependent oxidoreductase (nitroreductase family)
VNAAQPLFTSLGWRAGNALVGLFARAGVGPIQLLTTTGVRTGRTYTRPVVPVESGGRRWLVAPYGPVAWVRNARASGQVSLRHGLRSHRYAVREATAEEAGPVLKRYVEVATRTREHFDAAPDAPAAAFTAEAGRHPVFELVPLEPTSGEPRADDRSHP